MSWNKPKEIQRDMFGGELVRFSDRVAQQQPVKSKPVVKQAYVRPRPPQVQNSFQRGQWVPVSAQEAAHFQRTQQVILLLKAGKSLDEAQRIVYPENFRGE